MRHLRMTYNVSCNASIEAAKREYMGLYLDGDDPMVEHNKTTRRVLDEPKEQHVVVSDAEKRPNFMQSLGPALNGFVGVLESCVTFEVILQRCQAEAIRREQQKGRQSPSDAASGGKVASAFNTEQRAGKNGSKSNKKRDMSKVKCLNCQQLGHYVRNCTNATMPPSSMKEAASMAFSVEDTAGNDKRE
ncbi:hypothetical protein PHMEG_00036072 [Phytophthora megakarya]|uniref:CCHC-type domain-containing protein n=1 Tax=Phytophthora megakarya TaxID=4795 RepID=A0A225UMV4_9STRA|nr:hypothetical protein PHMEG_00036072 [Phytophthora megakarya]